MRRLKVLTWHVHGAYLYYLSQIPHDIFLPVKPGTPDGYSGRTPSYPWPDNVIEVPATEVRHLALDCVIYQSYRNYVQDAAEVFSDQQRARLPRIYLEHDPPREHPTDTKHPVDDKNTLIVHVTNFNRLMWNCGRSPTTVIEHGVLLPAGSKYRGRLERGVVVVNNIRRRGRRLGADIFAEFRKSVPLDLLGMGWREADGIGEYSYSELFDVISQYRFFFNPIRYTSLGLSVCEAMALGMPILGMATTELVTVIENGKHGYISTNPGDLIEPMKLLLRDHEFAGKMGDEARKLAAERFGIERFSREWSKTLEHVAGGGSV